MSDTSDNPFAFKRAARGKQACWVAPMGRTKDGKTLSSLLIADGARDILGGRIAMVSTEPGRGEHYAPSESKKGTYEFEYDHVSSGHHPRDIAERVRWAVEYGKAKVVVVDNMSHSWRYVLTEQEQFCLDSAHTWNKANPTKALRDSSFYNRGGWGLVRPWCDKLRDCFLDIGDRAMLILTHRAKLNVQLDTYLPIAEDEILFQSTVPFLITPGRPGHVEWPASNDKKVKQIFNCPAYLRRAFGKGPVDRETGRSLARWMLGKDCYREDAK